jgi:hypothetical protein
MVAVASVTKGIATAEMIAWPHAPFPTLPDLNGLEVI